MSETNTPKSSEAAAAPATVATPNAPATSNQSIPVKRSHLVTLFAVGLGICFFLPWFRFLFGELSGFQLQKENGILLLLWSMPIFAAITAVTALGNKDYRSVGQLAGATPMLILIWGLLKFGSDLLQALQPTAWITLLLGVALYIAARR